jgi:aryl-alcohol dehydrogenase-like predicted oxidoreductase
MNRDKILLPRKALQVQTPWLWIGTWSMGGEGFGDHDERESRSVLEMAVDSGLRHFDTAGFYGHGRSEALLGKLVRNAREELFLSTKGGLRWKGRKVEHCGAPRELREQLYESFERLGTDYLDLYQLHWPDPGVPLNESIAGLKDLQSEGLIRSWGMGNLSEHDIYDFLPPGSQVPHQVHFNPVHRTFNLLHAGGERCINCIISPLEQGLLTGRHDLSGAGTIGKKDLRRRNPYFSNIKVLAWSSRLNELHSRFRIAKVSTILMWICSQPHVHAVIPGPRRISQIEELLRFRADVETHGLLASGRDPSILSPEKVAEIIPSDIWKRLTKGP